MEEIFYQGFKRITIMSRSLRMLEPTWNEILDSNEPNASNLTSEPSGRMDQKVTKRGNVRQVIYAIQKIILITGSLGIWRMM